MLASTGLGCSLTVGTIVALFGNIFMEAICSLAGATPSILPCAKALIGTIFWGWSWMCFALMLNMQIRFEGESLSAILAIMSGAHITVFLNPSSVFGANLRIAGSALSNIACQGISFVALVTIMQRNGLMPFHLKYVRLSKAFFHGINRGGAPLFCLSAYVGGYRCIVQQCCDSLWGCGGDGERESDHELCQLSAEGNRPGLPVSFGLQPVSQKFQVSRAGFSSRCVWRSVSCLQPVLLLRSLSHS